MSLIKPLNINPIYVAALCIALSACATSPTAPSPYQKAKVDDIQINSPTTRKSSVELGTDDENNNKVVHDNRFVKQALIFENQASALPQPNQTLLNAAENYIQGGEFAKAIATVNQVTPLNEAESLRHSLIIAHIDYHQGNLAQCVQKTTAISNRLTAEKATTAASATDRARPASTTTSTTTLVDAQLLASRCLQALGDWNGALSQLVERENHLTGVARSTNLRYTWQLISELPQSTRNNIAMSTQNPALRNRIAQVEQSLATANAPSNSQLIQNPSSPVEQSPTATAQNAANQTIHSQTINSFSRWQDPIISKQQVQAKWDANSPKIIAVMLPLSSRFAAAANIVREGLESAHEANLSPYRPELLVYDLGADPTQAPLYFQAASSNGADLVIGPLGVSYINQVALAGRVNVPTITLGGTAEQRLANAVKFSISPEQEGRSASQFANSQGFSNVAILSDGSSSATRQANAFRQHWSNYGGRVVANVTFSANQYDHSTELKALFATQDSNARARSLNNTLGYKTNFEPYRRRDIDFIYLITNSDSGKIIRPQINFHAPSDLPVIGASRLYSGTADRTNNLDLEGVIIPQTRASFNPASQSSKHLGKKQDLYNLGNDAYLLASNLPMFTNPSTQLMGELGPLSVNTDNMVVSKPTWAVFVNGEVLPWDITKRTQFLNLKNQNSEQSNYLPQTDASNTSTGGAGTSKGNTYNAQTWNQGANSRR